MSGEQVQDDGEIAFKVLKIIYSRVFGFSPVELNIIIILNAMELIPN